MNGDVHVRFCESVGVKLPRATRHCITLAYPYCRAGDVSLCKRYYIAARACQGYIEKSTPRDFMNISSIVCGDKGSVQTTEQFIKKFDDTAASDGWCVLLLHGIDDDGGYSPVQSSVLRESLEYLAANKGRFWVSTFLNVIRYIRERDAVSVKGSSNQEAGVSIQVTDDLDNAIYNYPVTIRRPLPPNWSAADVSQNGKKVASSIVKIDSINYVMFDVVPDAGDVVLTKTQMTYSDETATED
jgi:hypothetical protein